MPLYRVSAPSLPFDMLVYAESKEDAIRQRLPGLIGRFGSGLGGMELLESILENLEVIRVRPHSFDKVMGHGQYKGSVGYLEDSDSGFLTIDKSRKLDIEEVI